MVRRWYWFLPLILVIGLIATRAAWLRAAGSFLVNEDPPAKAEMIVVLAGDQFGNRILKACELIREGYAPKALVSGPCCTYGRPESEPAIEFAVRNGCPSEWLVSFPLDAANTIEEAAKTVRELRRRGVRKFLAVTNNYHTRRTRKAYARFAPANDFRVIAAPDKYFKPDDWWRTRQAQKVLFLEWSKTFATWAGMGF
ncbi:MAG TPA: YdcF family protein [Bryobacteraceae bacterium]|nr:YdcF family protein [Bryobacteraceae bacterium]